METITHQPPMKQGSSDSFQTPNSALDIILPYLNKEWVVWDPACGKRNIVRYFDDKEAVVYGTDILDGENWDFFKVNLEDMNIGFDVIITNPPYSCKDKFIERCYEIGKPFALLMPLTALEGKKRQALYKKYGIQLIIPNKRINFETPSGNGSGSWFLTAWYCYKFNLPQDINFV